MESPTSTPAQRASFMQGPRYRSCRGCCSGEAGTGGILSTAGLVPFLLGALLVVLPEGRPLPDC